MLSPVTPTVSLQAKTRQGNQAGGIAEPVPGYLAVWAPVKL
jgi:hypothetical protein